MKLQYNKTGIWWIDTIPGDFGVNTFRWSHLGLTSCFVVLTVSLIQRVTPSVMGVWNGVMSGFSPKSCFSGSVRWVFLPHLSSLCRSRSVRMLHQAVCAGRSDAVPHWFLGSKTASGLLFWASVSFFGKWRYLDLKSKGLFWRQI